MPEWVYNGFSIFVVEEAGLGIRFPRFTGRVRDDKSPEQATTVEEIVSMYGMQSHDSDGLSDGSE